MSFISTRSLVHSDFKKALEVSRLSYEMEQSRPPTDTDFDRAIKESLKVQNLEKSEAAAQDSELERVLEVSKRTFAEEQSRARKGTNHSEAFSGTRISFKTIAPTHGGLPNIGNTCYLNSLIQAVFKHGSSYRNVIQTKANAVISEALIDDKNPQLSIREQKQLRDRARLLLRIIELSEENPTSVRPKRSIQDELRSALQIFRHEISLEYPQFASGQHDPVEAFLYISLFLDIGVNLPKIDIRTHLQTVNGQNSHFNKEPERIDVVVLASNESKSIQEALNKQFMTPETLEGDEKIYTSENGVEKSEGYKTDFPVCSGEFPDEIILQAPRFINRLQPPTKFFGYTLSPTQYVRGKNNNDIDFENEIVIPIFDDNGAKAIRKITLELVSVVGHKSRSDKSGHYVCYVRNQDDSFTLHNDSMTSIISNAEATRLIKKEGYLAVYRKLHDEVLNDEEAKKIGSLKTKVTNFSEPVNQINQNNLDGGAAAASDGRIAAAASSFTPLRVQEYFNSIQQEVVTPAAVLAGPPSDDESDDNEATVIKKLVDTDLATKAYSTKILSFYAAKKQRYNKYSSIEY